jgi:hypothetical protein
LSQNRTGDVTRQNFRRTKNQDRDSPKGQEPENDPDGYRLEHRIVPFYVFSLFSFHRAGEFSHRQEMS